ncbi:hypothetical protein MMC24_001894 [Lignoscripta atroalba]|nr:hypothetical protein [Lignoscripta atroalba]
MDPERSEPPESEFEILTSIRCGGIVDSCIENNDFGYHSLEKTKYYMFRYHRDRMLAAAQAFGWDKVAAMLRDDAGMEFIDRILESHINEKLGYQISETPLKLRLSITKDLATAVLPTQIPEMPVDNLFPNILPTTISNEVPRHWFIYLYPNAITPSLFTKHKTTRRSHYDQARGLISTFTAHRQRQQQPTPAPESETTDEDNTAMSIRPQQQTEVLLQNPEGEIMEGTFTTPYFFRDGKWVTPAERCGGNLGTTRRWALETGLCVEGIVRAEEVKDGELVWLSNGVRGWGWGKVELDCSAIGRVPS